MAQKIARLNLIIAVFLDRIFSGGYRGLLPLYFVVRFELRVRIISMLHKQLVLAILSVLRIARK